MVGSVRETGQFHAPLIPQSPDQDPVLRPRTESVDAGPIEGFIRWDVRENASCRLHGGLSTGPKAREGRIRVLMNLRQDPLRDPQGSEKSGYPQLGVLDAAAPIDVPNGRFSTSPLRPSLLCKCLNYPTFLGYPSALDIV